MLIHEVRRRHDEAPVHEFAGRMLQFKANEKGDVVCDVPDEIAQDLLTAVGSAMAPYEAVKAVKAPAPAPVKAEKSADVEDVGTEDSSPTNDQGADHGGSDGNGGDEPSAFVITSPDDKTFDLGKMTDDEVRAFAKEAGLPKPHHTKKGDALRQLVIDALKAA